MNSSITTWLTESPEWNRISLTLLLKDKRRRRQTTLEKVLENSDSFPVRFPIETVRCRYLLSHVNKEILTRNINSAYPLLHEHALHLYVQFLLEKRARGTPIEQKLYKDMSLLDFVNRLLTKRAVYFAGQIDDYELLTGECGMSNWETIGKLDEVEPLLLKKCLSYDEMKLSAFLSVSAYNYFINNGSWYSKGIHTEERSDLQDEGVVVGLIGPRMHRPAVMEHEDIVILQPGASAEIEERRTSMKGFFPNFYKEKVYKYAEVEQLVKNKDERFTAFNTGFFDNVTYAKRLTISFDTFLIEANHRAKQRGMKGYVYLVGIGLGVWRIAPHQEEIFVKTFAERLRVLGPLLNCISDVNFAFLPRTTTVAGYTNGDFFPINGHSMKGVTIHITRQLPFTKLPDPEKLLITSYAWDSNSAPGNEFWKGCLGYSSDSATAASCQISETHNALINEAVCAENLMVATQRGLLPIQEYLNIVRN